MTKILTKNPTAISSLVIDYSQRVHDWNPMVGVNGITKIEAYDEPGQMAYVAWFAIYVGDAVIWRVNGLYVVEVGYSKVPDGL